MTAKKPVKSRKPASKQKPGAKRAPKQKPAARPKVTKRSVKPKPRKKGPPTGRNRREKLAAAAFSTSHTCGMYGGIEEDGAPCMEPAGHGTPRKGYGRCSGHLDLGLPQLDDAHKNAFLVAFALTGNLSVATAASMRDRSAHYRWLAEEDGEYKAAFAVAKEVAVEQLEAEAWRRGVFGVDEPVYQGGKRVGTVRRYSDSLLHGQLNAHAPEKYRQRGSFEHSGPGGKPMQTETKVTFYLPHNNRNPLPDAAADQTAD